MEDGDVFPIYDTSQGRTRAVSVSTLRTFLIATLSQDARIDSVYIENDDLIFKTAGGETFNAGTLPTADTADRIKEKLQSLNRGLRLNADFVDEGTDHLFLTPTERHQIQQHVGPLQPDDIVQELEGLTGTDRLSTNALQESPDRLFLTQAEKDKIGTGAVSATDIRDKLASLADTDRLSADSLKNGNTNTFVSDDDRQKIDNAVAKDGTVTNGMIPKWNNGKLEDGYAVGTLKGNLITLVDDKKLPALDASELFGIGGTKPSGNGIDVDPDGLTQNSLVKWDNTTKKFVTANIYSNERGAITLEPSSLTLGTHNVQSNGDLIVIKNRTNGDVSRLVTQDIGENKNTATLRDYGFISVIELFRTFNTSVVNPDFAITGVADQSIFGVEIKMAQDAKDVLFDVRCTSDNDRLVWEYHAGDLSKGDHTIAFDTPIDLDPAHQYKMRMYRLDGNQMFVLGGRLASGQSMPYLFTHNADYVEREVATTYSIEQMTLVKSVVLDGDKLVVTPLTGTPTEIPFASDASITDLQSEVASLKTSIAKQATDIQNNLNTIASQKTELDTANSKISDLQQRMALAEAKTVTDMTLTGDISTRALTVKTLHNNSVLGTDTYSISTWFKHDGTVNPGPTSKIYYGFHPTNSLNEQSVIGGTEADVTADNVDGYQLRFSRSDSTSAFTFVWMPDSLGDVEGFDGGIGPDAWPGIGMNVQGVTGKVYVGNQPTFTQSVNYRIRMSND